MKLHSSGLLDNQNSNQVGLRSLSAYASLMNQELLTIPIPNPFVFWYWSKYKGWSFFLPESSEPGYASEWLKELKQEREVQDKVFGVACGYKYILEKEWHLEML